MKLVSKIKIFSNDHYGNLQEEVNKWAEETEHEIINTSMAVILYKDNARTFFISVTYKERV